MSPLPLTYAVCIQNTGVEASLEIRKIYQTLDDASAASAGMIRVIDESGEDYLYPRHWFVPMVPSGELLSALQLAS